MHPDDLGRITKQETALVEVGILVTMVSPYTTLHCLSYLSRMILVAIALNTNSLPSLFFTLPDETSMVAWTTTRSPSSTNTGVSLA